MRSRLCGLTALALLVGTALPAAAAWPRLFGPGTAPQQQRRAEKFDPFPDTAMGPGLAETRPRDFQRPHAEPLRAQWERWREYDGPTPNGTVAPPPSRLIVPRW